ncbi:MAG: aldehyde dehydrogenase family protein, partial [Planctomycetota bacterium]
GGAGTITSVNPAHPDRVVWQGTPVRAHVDQAVAAARRALPEWARTPIERRIAVLDRFAKLATEHADALGGLICDEAGKALWESVGEAKAVAAKVGITLDPQTAQNWGRARVTPFDLDLGGTKRARGHFRPHGVMAVVGPFNFPAHLPNGHIVPALLMGNTVVFKPSDKTPAVGQMLTELFDEALRAEGAPAGVINQVQGAAENAAALTSHPDINGILFTGSWNVGRRILEANLDRPGRVVALELGGNNPAIVMPDADLRQAAIEVARCAFNTTGQRCTSTRRLIVHDEIADKLVAAICKAASSLSVGDPRSETPVFMGPLVTREARESALTAQKVMTETGAEALVEMATPPELGEGPYITPGVLRVAEFRADPGRGEAGFDCGCDEEVFGPLLQYTTVNSFDEALAQANATRYGLAASVFTQDQASIDRFLAECRAGCVNVNCGTAGASSKLAFGGLGISGNHRPAGSYALDYCAYPVASMIEQGEAATIAPGMAFEDGWI